MRLVCLRVLWVCLACAWRARHVPDPCWLFLGMLGVCRDVPRVRLVCVCAWGVPGVSLECAWGVPGVCLARSACARSVLGVRLGCAWLYANDQTKLLQPVLRLCFWTSRWYHVVCNSILKTTQEATETRFGSPQISLFIFTNLDIKN